MQVEEERRIVGKKAVRERIQNKVVAVAVDMYVVVYFIDFFVADDFVVPAPGASG